MSSLPEKYRSKIRLGPGGCWIYTGKPNGSGYGIHKEVYELLIGPVPKGYELHHTCEIRICCNVFEHIEPKTFVEHAHIHTLITLDDELIYKLRKDGKLISEIAAEFGVSNPTIGRRLRAMGFETSIRPPKKQCHRGHEMTPENTYIDGNGSRRCHACLKATYNRYDRTNRRRMR